VPIPAPERTRPLRFDYDEPHRSLLVEWADGAAQLIPFPDLRLACPCAVCAGEMGIPGRFASQPQLGPGEDELADIALVGAYGLNTIWADGHSTGIYTFERLRELGDAAAARTRTG
jgi:DUF971 family protein